MATLADLPAMTCGHTKFSKLNQTMTTMMTNKKVIIHKNNFFSNSFHQGGL